MKENNLKAKYIKPYIQTTVSHDFSDKLKNLLNRHYNPIRPNVAWCTDITYIWTYDDGFVYLTSVMDLYSRSIISWILTKTMDADEVLKCIEKAKERVIAYVKDLLVLTDGEKEFLSKLKDKTYVPELLFDDETIISNIKHHPAALWRVREN